MPQLDDQLDAIAAFVSGTVDGDALSDLMVAQASPGVRARVYRNSSLLAASDALRSNYPAVRTLLGEEAFSAMARGYIETHRPRARSLVGYGAELPAFLDAMLERHGLAVLGDIARLDRAWLEAHLAREADAFTPEAFAELAGDEARLVATRLALAPHVRRVQTGWPLHDGWQTLRAGERVELSEPPPPETEHSLVWRPHGEVVSRALTPGEAGFLQAISGGATLGDAAARALEADSDLDIATLLGATVSAGLYTQPKQDMDPDQ